MSGGYDRRMREEIAKWRRMGRQPRLLLHACCAPCSSACLERLRQDFKITVFYFNPNIDAEEEYRKRAAEERRLIDVLNRQIFSGDYAGVFLDPEAGKPQTVEFLEGDYRPEDFHKAAEGLENEPEGGARCEACFRLRLHETARVAATKGFDCFTTTLTISPLKNADLLNEIGKQAGAAAGVLWLPSDFKKQDGYKRSIELSARYGLYRQDYCGCSYSLRERHPESG